MEQVVRYDAVSALRSPTITAQGFLRADGHAARCGVQVYRNDDGTERRELRLPEEVFRADALAGFEGAPITAGHPPEMITAANAARYTKGTATQPARRDGDLVAASIVITDPTLIARVQRGDNGMSVGYLVEYDPTPGVHPKYGRYDGVQRRLVINHIAVGVVPRAGDVARIRLDGVEVSASVARADAIYLTAETLGHQHLIDTTSYDGAPRAGGSTSWAIEEGSKDGHEHPWVRNADGSITVGASGGHTHVVLPQDRYAAQKFDRSAPRGDGDRMANTMTLEAQVGALKLKLDETSAKLANRNDEAEQAIRERDAANGRLKTLEDRIISLEGQLSSGASALETEAIRAQAARADAAELKLATLEAKRSEDVRRAAELRIRAQQVMPSVRFDGQSDREIQCAVIRHFAPKDSTGAEVSDAFIAARFDSLVEAHMANARALTRIGEVAGGADGSAPKNSRTERAIAWRNQAIKPV